MALVKCDAYCSSLLVALAVSMVAYLWLDPFQKGSLAGLNFHPENVDPPPSREEVYQGDAHNRLKAAELKYVEEFFGPESIAFDSTGAGPYVGLSDGRVVRRSEDDKTWETVAVTAPTWNATICSYPAPPGLPRPKLPTEHICGRPLGLRFHPITGDLYVADAYFGIFLVPKIKEDCRDGKESPSLEAVEGAAEQDQEKTCEASSLLRPNFGPPELVVGSVEGTKLRFANDLDIDATESEGVIYFTDTSTKFNRRNFLVCIFEGGTHGRLVKHDLASNSTTVLARGLRFPNGVALSKDRSFLVFCETTVSKCHKYFIKGPKAGTWEKLIDLPGLPDNVRLNPRGRFWIAIHSRRNAIGDFLMMHKWARWLVLKLIPDVRAIYLLTVGYPHGLVLEVDEDGKVTEVLEDAQGAVVKAVSEVEEHDGKLWMGSVLMPHVAVLDRKS